MLFVEVSAIRQKFLVSAGSNTIWQHSRLGIIVDDRDNYSHVVFFVRCVLLDIPMNDGSGNADSKYIFVSSTLFNCFKWVSMK